MVPTLSLDRWMSPSTRESSQGCQAANQWTSKPHRNCRKGTCYVNGRSPTLKDFVCISFMFLFYLYSFIYFLQYFFQRLEFYFLFTADPQKPVFMGSGEEIGPFLTHYFFRPLYLSIAILRSFDKVILLISGDN